MKKNIIILALAIYSVIATQSHIAMTNRAKVLLQECKLASNVINQVINDQEDYFYDVLVETDTWCNYVDIIPFDYYE